MTETDGVCISRLISLVKERPVLWDRQEEVYKNRKLTKKAWAEICETLLDNYSELAEEDQKSFGRSVIGKWANLRDNWLRYWRKRQDHLRSGLCGSRFKKYIHHEQLMFLSKVYDQCESEMQQEVEEIQVEVDVLSDPGTDSPLGFSSEEVSQTPWNYGVNSEEASQTLWSLPLEREIPEEKSPPTIPPLTEEHHLYFFQSTLPLIADFDESQALEFHGAVLESIKRIKNGKNSVNVVPTPQPAYILAIAQPQGFLTNTELKPKVIMATNTAKQCSEPPEQTVQKRNSENVCSLNMSSKGTQITNSSKHTHTEGKTGQAVNAMDNKPTLSELELSDLKTVVNRLDEISKKFETYPFEDSYDKFGKYIGSFLKSLPPKKAQFLKRRIIRQVLRVQLTEKSNCNHLGKPDKRLNQNDSILLKACIRTNEDVTSNLISVEKVTKPTLENAFQKTTQKPINTCVDESTNSVINNSKPNSTPPLLEPLQFTCHICASIHLSSADLHSHCASQHRGYSPSVNSRGEPVKRGRRGRKRKDPNSEVTT